MAIAPPRPGTRPIVGTGDRYEMYFPYGQPVTVMDVFEGPLDHATYVRCLVATSAGDVFQPKVYRAYNVSVTPGDVVVIVYLDGKRYLFKSDDVHKMQSVGFLCAPPRRIMGPSDPL